MQLFRRQALVRIADRHTLVVEGGQVVCPARGVTDIENCWVCPGYRGQSDGPGEQIVCHGNRRTSLAARNLII